MKWSKRRETRKKKPKPHRAQPNHCNAMKENQETRAANSFPLTHPHSANTEHISRLRPAIISNMHCTYKRKYSTLNVLHFSEQSKACGNIKQAIFCFSFLFNAPIPNPFLFLGIFPHLDGEHLCMRNVSVAAREQCQMKIHDNANTVARTKKKRTNEKWQLFSLPCLIRTTR